jgi:hypothetical protein
MVRLFRSVGEPPTIGRRDQRKVIHPPKKSLISFFFILNIHLRERMGDRFSLHQGIVGGFLPIYASVERFNQHHN